MRHLHFWVLRAVPNAVPVIPGIGSVWMYLDEFSGLSLHIGGHGRRKPLPSGA
jgi:hypothetical protein